MTTVHARFVEEDDIVEMEVNERNTELLGDETGNETEDEEEVPGLTVSEEESEEEEEGEISSQFFDPENCIESASEVTFPNRSNNSTGQKKKSFMRDETEEMDEAEEKSMMKFARYLEKKGYIQRMAEDNRTGCHDNQKQQGKQVQMVQGSGQGREPQNKGRITENAGLCKLPSLVPSVSDTTIYKGAVAINIPRTDGGNNEIPRTDNKRDSSSSEEPIDTSDEMMNTSPCEKVANEFAMFQRFLDFQLKEQRRMVSNQDKEKNGSTVQVEEQPQPSTSKGGEKQARKSLVQQAETAKANLYQIPGKDEQEQPDGLLSNNDILTSILLDEKYDLVENHVDEGTRRKILNGEYIDLARLIPRDRVQIQKDHRMVQVNRNGQSFYEPASEHETAHSINSYSKWEQAFRVFSTIYVMGHPKRAKELMQYSHTIFTASLTYLWDNVYAYDMDFRIHMSKNTERSWGVILALAWNMRLTEKLKPGIANTHGANGGNSNNNSYAGAPNTPRVKKVCWRYNRGKCTYGFNCKFEHKCGTCGKFGHGSHICRKARNNGNGSGSGFNGNNNGSGPMRYFEPETGEYRRDYKEKKGR